MKKKTKTFREVLAEIESPQDIGQGSWALPENATLLEQAKYDICQKILAYQQDNNLNDEEMANKIKVTIGEVRDILYCHINYFTLERLITYAESLFSTLEIKIIPESKKTGKNTHAQAV